MKKLPRVILLLTLLLFSQKVFAQTARETSFDDRPTCEEVGGVWRQFGNGCIDQCRPKLDKFAVCTQEITGGCDCGKGKCWNGETCVLLKDYSEIYNNEVAEEKKVLAAAKKSRHKMAMENQQSILERMSKTATVVAQSVSDTTKSTISQGKDSVQDSISKASDKISQKQEEIKIPEFFSKQQQNQQQQQKKQEEGFFGKIFSSKKVELVPIDGRSSSLPNQQQNQQQEEVVMPPVLPGLPEIALPD